MFAELGLLAALFCQTATRADIPGKQEHSMRLDHFGDPLPPSAVLRLGTTRFRHGWGVECVEYEPSGKYLLSGGSDNAVRVWDINGGKEVATFQRHPNPSDLLGNQVFAIAASPKGDVVAAACGVEDCCIILCSIANKKQEELRSPEMKGVKFIAFSPDGSLLACVGSMDVMHVWSIADKKLIRSLFLEGGSCGGVAFIAGDGESKVAVALKDRVQFWNLIKGQKVKTISCNGVIKSICASSDGSRVGCALRFPENKKVLVFDVADGWKTLEVKCDIGINCVRFTPDGKYFVGGGRALRVWETSTRKIVRRIGEDGNGCSDSLAIAPNGKVAAAGLDLWNLENGERELRFAGHEFPVEGVAFLPGNKGLLTCGDDATFRLWDMKNGKQTRVVSTKLEGVFPELRAFSPDGRVLACAYGAEVVCLYDGDSGKECARIKDAEGVGFMAFSPDSKILAIGNKQNTVSLYSATGKKIRTLKGHSGSIEYLCFLSGGKGLASGSRDGTVRVWDANTGEETGRLDGCEERILVMATSGDGTLLATGHSGSITLWDLARGKQVRSVKMWRYGGRESGQPSVPSCLAFSPDCKQLMWADVAKDSAIRVLSVAALKEVRKFEGHRGPVHCLSFSEDGKFMVSGSTDTTALVWDIADR